MLMEDVQPNRMFSSPLHKLVCVVFSAIVNPVEPVNTT